MIDPYCDDLLTFVTCTDQNIQSSAIATLGTLIKYEKLANVKKKILLYQKNNIFNNSCFKFIYTYLLESNLY